jgi:hypothetical protein
MRVTSDVGPFSITPEWVLDAEISDRAVRLYGLLGRYADAKGEAFPRRRTLAERLNCSINSLDRAVAELKSIGALETADRWRMDGGQSANLVTLRMSPPVGHPLPIVGDPPLPTGAAPNKENHLERETSLPNPKTNGKVAADRIWDALTDIFGAPTTRSAETLRGKIVASLNSAGATPDEIVRRARTWPNHFDSATLTPTALEKHWDALGLPPMRRTR